MVLFSDSLTLDAPKRTADGYMAVRAKAARTGTYAYLGSEIDPDNAHGLRDAGIVNVLRDDSAVFDAKAARSFIGKPVTNNHPSVAVNAGNWRDHARGVVMGAMREGDYLAFDLLLTDAGTIDAVSKGKRELSNGYAAELQFGDFTGPGGVKCVAKQASISGNHVAIVDHGRAGPSCAITDSVAICDANTALLADLTPPVEKQMKKIVLDGLQVDLSDADAVAAAISKLQSQISDGATAKVAVDAQVATLTTDKASLEAKVTTLEQQVADAALTPAKLRDAAKEYANVCDKAKARGVVVAEDASTETIMRAVVDAHLGDKAKGWTADQVAISFATLDATPAKPVVQPIGAPKHLADSASVVSTLRAARYA